jgi:hypothetical protein
VILVCIGTIGGKFHDKVEFICKRNIYRLEVMGVETGVGGVDLNIASDDW